MITKAVLFAPERFELALTYPVKGVPFFLFSTLKISKLIGKENMAIATDSPAIESLCEKFGLKSIPLLPDLKDFTDKRVWKWTGRAFPEICIAGYTGMPNISEESLLLAIEQVKSKNMWFYASNYMPQFMNARNPAIKGEKEFKFFYDQDIMMPFQVFPGSCLKVNTVHMGDSLNLNPAEAMIFTDIRHVESFSKSEACADFFQNLSPEVLQFIHPVPVKMLLLDVDGVLTDGGMYYTESGDEFKKFDTKDGLVIKKLTQKGFPIGIISAGKNHNLIENRAKLLGIQYCFVGFTRKIDILDAWLEELNIGYENVLYIGDDLVDLEIFDSGVLSACPADAVKTIRDKAKIILAKKGGEGCVRELVDNYLGYLLQV